MPDLVFALDPGQTTGWAMFRRSDKALLGLGDLEPNDLGSAIDLLVRTMHLAGYSLAPIVELLPSVSGVSGDLQVELAFVRQTIDHWLIEVFELDVEYVLPGTWKSSRAAQTNSAPDEWNGVRLSQHMKDAYLMACYKAKKR